MEPPIHTEYLRSGMFLYIVVPPDITMLPYRSFRMSTSHFMIDVKVSLWIPSCSSPRNCGWNKASGALNRSAPTVMTWPSGSS